MAIVYTLVVLPLVLYAVHRLLVLWDFAGSVKIAGSKPPEPEKWPSVLVQVPLFNEYDVASRIIDAVAKIRYPREALEIQILDDSTDQTPVLVNQLVEQYSASGLNISHLRRECREGFKAGALREGLKFSRAEFVAVFDADFVPSPDFLEKVVPHFSQPDVDLVQTRWSYLNRQFSLLTRAQAILLDGHFFLEHSARYFKDLFFNFNGTAGVWRRSAIERAGGWHADTLTEDLDLSYRAQLKGSRFVYLVDHSVPSELPVSFESLLSQQHRWTSGAMQVLKKLWRDLLFARISPRVKLEALVHLGANLCYPFLLAAVILLPFLIPVYAGQLSHSAEPTPIVFGFIAVLVYYLATANQAHRRGVKVFSDACLGVLLGISLSLSNSLAVWEGLFSSPGGFSRTPKTGVAGNELSGVGDTIRTWRSWLVHLEVLLVVYLVLTLLACVYHRAYLLIPYTLLFLLGFGFALSSRKSFQRKRRQFLEAQTEALCIQRS